MPNINIEEIKSVLAQEIKDSNSAQDLEALRIKYLGRKGVVAQLMSQIPGLPQEERVSFGQTANALKNFAASLIDEKNKSINASNSGATVSSFDIGMPGIAQELGQLHPITQIIDEICKIFTRMGFSIVEGPEIETEYNNFTGLNIPLDHPSRDAFDTFYLKDTPHLLLRSHTSPVQIRAMKKYKPPLAIVVPGRVYRPDATDASHLFMFNQVEGFVVDENITFADLKGTLETFAKAVFGEDIKMRFRPHFFPFTEPSAEVDISCVICKGKGCSSCGRKGWLEILGSGMIHPNVFKHVGYDPKKYTGFAFGMGIERIAMLKYGIKDIRLFCENDLRFLKQF
ncbi:MAG: phenylalanine--tRNA ligase subunit alpha [Candidatus Omnitrophica bacterium]|nr:phenylalanine--tRNA ligase subunit alpha [Candidatus Omnitrophota bacterium]